MSCYCLAAQSLAVCVNTKTDISYKMPEIFTIIIIGLIVIEQ